MSSSTTTGVPPAESAVVPQHASAEQQLAENEASLEIDDSDSTYGDSIYSDTTSLSSSIVRGIVENGRRYQTLREGKYWGPSDEQAFESMNISDSVYLTLDSKEANPLFRSPIGENIHNILDLGTGDANWAFHVADSYPSAHVTGVDLYPAPTKFMPPNCELLVDDIAKPWLYGNKKFDLIHSRFLVGSFTPGGWRGLYKQAYENLVPGGWLEVVEPSLCMYSDDGSLPADSKCAKWGPMFYEIGDKVTGQPMDVCYTMKESIAAAGFVNMQEKLYKIPIGGWAKNPVLKQAGKLYLEEVSTGLEGYALYLLTKSGLPQPWSVEDVKAHLKGVKEEWANPNYHIYTLSRRIWCQKPFNAEKPSA